MKKPSITILTPEDSEFGIPAVPRDRRSSTSHRRMPTSRCLAQRKLRQELRFSLLTCIYRHNHKPNIEVVLIKEQPRFRWTDYSTEMKDLKANRL